MPKRLERRNKLSKIPKSKMKIRQQIVYALAHGANGGRRDNGIVMALLKKLDDAIDRIDPDNVDGLTKLATTVIRLSGLAMPTAYQAEALEKGLAPGDGQRQLSAGEVLQRIEEHLAQRRLLMAKTTQVIDITPKPNASIISQAKQELSQRLTPPPVPPPRGGVDEDGDRPPTHSPHSPQENINGTKQASISIEEIDFDIPELKDLETE